MKRISPTQRAETAQARADAAERSASRWHQGSGIDAAEGGNGPCAAHAEATGDWSLTLKQRRLHAIAAERWADAAEAWALLAMAADDAERQTDGAPDDEPRTTEESAGLRIALATEAIAQKATAATGWGRWRS